MVATISSLPPFFTDLNPIPSSSIPRIDNPGYEAHLNALFTAGHELMSETPKWMSKGVYHDVETFQRHDYTGKRGWFMRRSLHKDIPFETFKRGLYDNHSTNEKEYIGGLLDAKLVEAINPGEVEVWLNSYHIPLFSERDFVSSIFFRHYPSSPSNVLSSFMIISRPVIHPDAPPVPGFIRGMYESVEIVRELPDEGGIEWIMTTASSPEGNIPIWVSEKVIPGKIAEDVPAFTNWIKSMGWCN